MLLATGLRGRVEGEEVGAVVAEEVRVDWVKGGSGVVGRVAAAESGGVAMASACRMIWSMISGAL